MNEFVHFIHKHLFELFTAFILARFSRSLFCQSNSTEKQTHRVEFLLRTLMKFNSG